MAYAVIRKGKLTLVSDGGSVTGMGVRGFRAAIKQIEASQLPLSDNTKAMLAIYRDGVALWEARKQ